MNAQAYQQLATATADPSDVQENQSDISVSEETRTVLLFSLLSSIFLSIYLFLSRCSYLYMHVRVWSHYISSFLLSFVLVK